jgi:hypothetical protein
VSVVLWLSLVAHESDARVVRLRHIQLAVIASIELENSGVRYVVYEVMLNLKKAFCS